MQAAPLGRYPAEVEATVYFCCLEAIQNACKHAGDGATLALRVWEEGAALAFDVSDDGAGFDASDHGLGAGFTNMQDRLCALRGSLRVESAPGRGTRVSGKLPARQGAGTGRGGRPSPRPPDRRAGAGSRRIRHWGAGYRGFPRRTVRPRCLRTGPGELLQALALGLGQRG